MFGGLNINMEHIKDYNIDLSSPTAVTIGNFDGLHRGHRELVALTKELAEKEGLKSVVFTFSPHPMFVFKNREHSALIMSPDEKEYIIRGMGVDVYIEYPFDLDFAAMEPERFAEDIIFDKLNCKVLVVGENYKFGARQAGNYDLLKKLGEKRGIKVTYVPSVTYDNKRVSSTRIRKCLVDNDVDMANRLLSEPFFVMGEVAQGKKLGRMIGFPTINIIANPVKLFPPNGVYATITLYNGKYYAGVTNIGYKPTVDGSFKGIETFLFDFHQFVYGETLLTYVFHRIRDEVKFPSVEALREQMGRDAQSAREYFESGKFDYWREKYSQNQ